MGWFQKTKGMPKELEDMTEEQILEKVKKSGELETQLTAAQQKQTELEAKLTTESGERQKLKDSLTALEAKVTAPPPPPNAPKAPTSFLDDEEAAFNERVAPTQAISLHAGAMAARLSFEQAINGDRSENGQVNRALYYKYAAEVQDLMNREAPVRRMLPEVWQMAFEMVRGRHSNEIYAAAKKGDNSFFSEGVTDAPPPLQPRRNRRTCLLRKRSVSLIG